jgi:hypothetical protein
MVSHVILQGYRLTWLKVLNIYHSLCIYCDVRNNFFDYRVEEMITLFNSATPDGNTPLQSRLYVLTIKLGLGVRSYAFLYGYNVLVN